MNIIAKLLSHFSFAILAVMTLAACAKPQGDDRLREKAEIEARTDQDVVDKKAQEMEARLTRQQRFYQGVSGIFAGVMKVPGSKPFNVRFVMSPTIAAYDGERIRNVDEITYDLTNLSLTIEETTSFRMSDGSDYSSGCNYTDVRPKTDAGFIHATTSGCPVTFMISLSSDPSFDDGRVSESRESVSRKVLNGELSRIDSFDVEMRSVHKSSTEKFKIHRVQ